MTTNKRKPLARVMWHHCIVFLKNCSDVNLDIHFKYILSADLDLTVALRPKLLPFQGLEKGNHSLVHMSSGTEPKYSNCMPDASSFHDIAFAWPSAPHNYSWPAAPKHTWIVTKRQEKEKYVKKKTHEKKTLKNPLKGSSENIQDLLRLY
jgi:hypothetical protein